jgi:CubicO group peptidase (beta-lactamase class C family)
MTRVSRSRFSIAVALAALLIPAAPQVSAAQGGPPPEVRAAIQEIVNMLKGNDDASLRSFAGERMAPAYRASMSEEALFTHLRSLRALLGPSVGAIGVERGPDGLTLVMEGDSTVAINFDLDDSFRVTKLGRGEAPSAEQSGPPSPWDAATWENLGSHFRRWEGEGFSGVVLAHRSGKPQLKEAYGSADPASNRRTAINTIYGIGSTPIDFTRTGILLLAQRKQLSLDDSIGKYWPETPAEKRGMTLTHLMTGRSGLPDFHGVSGVDWDADLAWIDRATAVKRILAQPQLFAPGTREAHSHSAFGLLAAVIEIVSDKTYQEFVRSEMLIPLGMTRTGFNGERGGFTVDDFAFGAGPSFVGVPNIPPNWGPTSWLIMGSGGMYSTLDDMAKYYEGIEKGRILTGEWANWQRGETVSVGGSERGFFIFRVANGRGDSVLGLMNGEGRSAATRGMMRAVERLVFERERR